MYDLIRYTLAIHVRIGWFESGARNYLSAKKKGSLLHCILSGGNVYANLRRINVRENALTLLYVCVSIVAVLICGVLKLRVFAKKYLFDLIAPSTRTRTNRHEREAGNIL